MADNEKTRKPPYNQEQYEMLLRCSEKKDISEWNQWRKDNPGEEIELEGADLKGAFLRFAHLEGANLQFAHLEGANLRFVHLEEANLWYAHLEGADLVFAHLEGADFRFAYVNNKTAFFVSDLDRETDFRDVSLDTVRINQGLKQSLKYNVRRKNWGSWYKGRSKKKWKIKLRQVKTSPVRLFWLISDYGRSAFMLIWWFFWLASLFAVVYYLFPAWLLVNGKVGDLHGLLHAFYFSIVTMTTLGFGDIAANPDSWLGQTLLMFQVLWGYFLLGALITRLNILFTSGGPAYKFPKKKKKKKKTRPKINTILID